MKKELTIKFRKTLPTAKLPTHAHETGDAGFDIYAAEQTELLPGQVKMVRTGLQLADCPSALECGSQYFFDMRSRSGLSKFLVLPVTGTIDTNYRGEIMVVLANFSDKPYTIVPGDRIAQLVIQKIVAASETQAVTFSETDVVTETNRGSGGFGSTGR